MNIPTSGIKTGDFVVRGDERGQLIAIESERQVPFPIRRVYYIYGTIDGIARGKHAHRELDQVAVCVRGSCVMTLDDGSEVTSVTLDKPNRWVRILPMVWHEMSVFSEDCVMVVFASDYYDEADYIREYPTFVDLIAKIAS